MAAELNNFQINTLKIISILLEQDVVDDSILEELWKNELEYFSLLEKYKLLSEKMNIDEKTGLLKYSDSHLTDIVKTASRIMSNNRYPHLEVGFVRFDIDDFSKFNNKYGHDLGDEILKKVSGIIRDYSRPTDYVIRFGGEEFDVILPSTNLNGAQVYVNKILDETRKINFHYDSKKKIKTTMSAGITTCRLSTDSAAKKDDVDKEYKNLQRKADDALYEAKFLGKNRFSIYSSARSEEYSKIRSEYARGR
jgi:diguanylate cyclase (GGDEF)-like protein